MPENGSEKDSHNKYRWVVIMGWIVTVVTFTVVMMDFKSDLKQLQQNDNNHQIQIPGKVKESALSLTDLDNQLVHVVAGDNITLSKSTDASDTSYLEISATDRQTGNTLDTGNLGQSTQCKLDEEHGDLLQHLQNQLRSVRVDAVVVNNGHALSKSKGSMAAMMVKFSGDVTTVQFKYTAEGVRFGSAMPSTNHPKTLWVPLINEKTLADKTQIAVKSIPPVKSQAISAMLAPDYTHSPGISSGQPGDQLTVSTKNRIPRKEVLMYKFQLDFNQSLDDKKVEVLLVSSHIELKSFTTMTNDKSKIEVEVEVKNYPSDENPDNIPVIVLLQQASDPSTHSNEIHQPSCYTTELVWAPPSSALTTSEIYVDPKLSPDDIFPMTLNFSQKVDPSKVTFGSHPFINVIPSKDISMSDSVAFKCSVVKPLPNDEKTFALVDLKITGYHREGFEKAEANLADMVAVKLGSVPLTVKVMGEVQAVKNLENTEFKSHLEFSAPIDMQQLQLISEDNHISRTWSSSPDDKDKTKVVCHFKVIKATDTSDSPTTVTVKYPSMENVSLKVLWQEVNIANPFWQIPGSSDSISRSKTAINLEFQEEVDPASVAFDGWSSTDNGVNENNSGKFKYNGLIIERKTKAAAKIIQFEIISTGEYDLPKTLSLEKEVKRSNKTGSLSQALVLPLPWSSALVEPDIEKDVKALYKNVTDTICSYDIQFYEPVSMVLNEPSEGIKLEPSTKPSGPQSKHQVNFKVTQDDGKAARSCYITFERADGQKLKVQVNLFTPTPTPPPAPTPK